jgi:hypothetical protein
MSLKAKLSMDGVEQEIVNFAVTDSTQFTGDSQYTFYYSLILSIVTIIIPQIYNLEWF